MCDMCTITQRHLNTLRPHTHRHSLKFHSSYWMRKWMWTQAWSPVFKDALDNKDLLHDPVNTVLASFKWTMYVCVFLALIQYLEFDIVMKLYLMYKDCIKILCKTMVLNLSICFEREQRNESETKYEPVWGQHGFYFCLLPRVQGVVECWACWRRGVGMRGLGVVCSSHKFPQRGFPLPNPVAFNPLSIQHDLWKQQVSPFKVPASTAMAAPRPHTPVQASLQMDWAGLLWQIWVQPIELKGRKWNMC